MPPLVSVCLTKWNQRKIKDLWMFNESITCLKKSTKKLYPCNWFVRILKISIERGSFCLFQYHWTEKMFSNLNNLSEIIKKYLNYVKSHWEKSKYSKINCGTISSCSRISDKTLSSSGHFALISPKRSRLKKLI